MHLKVREPDRIPTCELVSVLTIMENCRRGHQQKPYSQNTVFQCMQLFRRKQFSQTL